MIKKNSAQGIISNFKNKNIKNLIQSPYLYLQTTGSDSQDGSSDGFHLRWDYLRNLGATHLPKGDLATTNLNFNKKDDFVRLVRSRYNRRFPTIIDFSVQAPNVVNDLQRFWIYLNTNTNTVVYIHFRDVNLYNNARASINPISDTLQFMEKYGKGLIEVEVKDKLFFAAEIEAVVGESKPVMRVEAISVFENLPVTDLFVSCRKIFTEENWCGDVEKKTNKKGEENTLECCAGKENLIANGDFEEGPTAFETQYRIGGIAAHSTLWVSDDARVINGSWRGRAFSGKQFLIVDGATKPNTLVWKQSVKVQSGFTYCFSGNISTLFTQRPAKLAFIFESNDGIKESFFVTAPSEINIWEAFKFEWTAGLKARNVNICIYDHNVTSIGNDFGLDNLQMCEKSKCQPRIVSENIRKIRFDVQNGFARKIELETYEDYIQGAEWIQLDEQYALSKDDVKVLENWLDNPNLQVHDRWPKFNDGAKVNIENYKDRWFQAGGLKKGVLKYIALSDNDPLAMDLLPGAEPVDGSVEVSYLDMLKLVALDFHVARMFGQGTIDQPKENYDGPYIYLAFYRTEGLLDLDKVAQTTNHFYMSVPTTRRDNRLPERPVLKDLKYGLFIDNGLSTLSPLTDAEGYTPDCQIRFISTFIEQEDADPILRSFFNPPELFCAIDKTNNVFWGMEYRKVGATQWQKPEVAHDPIYLDTHGFPETNPIPNSGNENKAVLVHEERESGFHEYAAYGINWFSRASVLSNIRQTDETKIKKSNTLIPPSNFQVQLIQEESPLLLTTAQEQSDLANVAIVPGPDKTYIRVSFDYFHTHDLNYKFANQVKLYFRENAPRQTMGKIKSVIDHSTNPKLVIVRTMAYTINSTGQSITPTIPLALMNQFIGGIFTTDGKRFIIENVNISGLVNEGPIFTLRKIVEQTAVSPGGGGSFMTSEVLIAPEQAEIFLVVENLADPNSWGNHNPLGKVIQLGDPSWVSFTENYIEDGEAISNELRGIWETVNISDVPEVGTGNIIGIYELQFTSYQLDNHIQANDTSPVNWYKGVVRIARNGDLNGPKKVLEVIKIEELGTGLPLRIFAVDNTFSSTDRIPTGNGIVVNYYPGYRVYLLSDIAHHLDEAHILPAAGEGHKKTWMGVVSVDSAENFNSNIGIPAPLVAMELIEPFPPEAPGGAEYATRPDFYYKSTYTFTVQFTHQPFAAVFYRATEDAILRALYKEDTITMIRTALQALGEEDPYLADRWKNLVSFDYIYDDSSRPYYDPTGSNQNGTFRRFPREAGNFRFPKPDKIDVFTGTQEPGVILEDVKAAIYEIFTPLTELPLLYQHIKGGNYQVIPKQQTIRDQYGVLLDPTNPKFDQAPMAKNLGGNKIQFTDFTLDGASNMLYFYMGREIGNRGKMSNPSPISGPILLINTKPGDAPGVKKIYAIPKGLGTKHPSIEFEINGYATEQKIRKLEIYRTISANDALTVRTMDKVKTIDLVSQGMDTSTNYKIRDDFENGFVPYGEPLFYRIIGLREVKNAQGDTEWAPSLPSKLLMTAMIDTENPPIPLPRFTSNLPVGNPATISNIVIEWDTTIYNGTYYLEKMNNAGNWNTIYTIKSNQPMITVDLSATSLGSNVLEKSNDSGQVIYNRFRVRVENSAGLFGLEEKVLRI